MAGKKLVVDACVACSAGSRNDFPSSKFSREALKAIKAREGHVLVFSIKLSQEWKAHAGAFGSLFRVEMQRSGRVVVVSDDVWKSLLPRCKAQLSANWKKASFEKDFHVIALALETDRIIISNETNLLQHLVEMRTNIPEVNNLHWGNPTLEEQACIDWLRSGAKIHPGRMIARL